MEVQSCHGEILRLEQNMNVSYREEERKMGDCGGGERRGGNNGRERWEYWYYPSHNLYMCFMQWPYIGTMSQCVQNVFSNLNCSFSGSWRYRIDTLISVHYSLFLLPLWLYVFQVHVLPSDCMAVSVRATAGLRKWGYDPLVLTTDWNLNLNSKSTIDNYSKKQLHNQYKVCWLLQLPLRQVVDSFGLIVVKRGQTTNWISKRSNQSNQWIIWCGRLLLL